MDLQGMEYVYEVYREKSFSKAAANLYISQPSLSVAVKKVEQKLGFPIFDRSTTPIGLTELGQAYINSVERIMVVENELDQFISDRIQGNTGRIAIGGTALFTSYFLPPILSAYHGAFPKITVELEELDTSRLQERLMAGKLDLVADNGTFDSQIIGSEILCQDHIVLAVPKVLPCNEKAGRYQIPLEVIRDGTYLQDTYPTAPISIFSQEPFLLLKLGNDTRKRADRIFKEGGVHPDIRLQLDQQITGYNLSCHGMGISFVSDTLLKLVKPEESLVYYKLAETQEARRIALFYKRNRYRTQAMKEFLRIAHYCMEGNPEAEKLHKVEN